MDSVVQFDPLDPASFGSPAKRGWRALGDFRFEIALLLLLLVTFLAVRFQDVLLGHVIVIEPKDTAIYTPRAYADAPTGGNSIMIADPRTPLEWRCVLRSRYAFHYCGYELLIDARTPDKGLDLSRFDTVTLDLDYAGPWDSFRVYLKNFDKRYSKPGDVNTLKYNKIEVAIQPGRNVVKLNFADFGVAEWWVTQYKIRPGLSTTEFGNITELEIQTGTRAPVGNYYFHVHRIALHGRLISRAAWYGGLLATWAALLGFYLAYRIFRLRKDLEQRRLSQAAALRLAQYAEESARRDYLTKLLNRSGIIEMYHPMAMNRRTDASFAVMMLDVDHFKLVNDRFGHMAGDEVLAGVAEVLRENTRSDDIVGRWGGEEFLLICMIADQEAAMHIADKVRAGIEEHDFGRVGQVTASLGVYCCSGPMDALEQLVSYADAALYAAKEQGRNRVIMYQPFMREAA